MGGVTIHKSDVLKEPERPAVSGCTSSMNFLIVSFLISGTMSSRTCPHAAACERKSSRSICACLRRRSRCWVPKSSTCFFAPLERSSFCSWKSVKMDRSDSSSAHIVRFCWISDSPTRRLMW